MNSVYFSIHLDSNIFKDNPVYVADIEAQFDELEEKEEGGEGEEEEEEKEEKECRICLEPSGNLIVVCDCKGSCKYVHKECIETWMNSLDHDDIRYNKCEICKSNYNFELLDLDQHEEDDCNCNALNTSCKVIIALLFGFVFSILMFTLIIMIVY